MKPIIALIRLIVFSNIFVAICATALTHLSYIFLDLTKAHNAPVLIVVFCSTYFIYNIQRIVRMSYDKLIGKNIGVRLSWIVRNRIALFLSSIILMVVAAIALFFVKSASFLTVLPLGIISILYVTPFIPLKGKWISLRRVPFIKIFIIAIIWAIVTVALPFINEFGFSNFDDNNFQLTLLTRFLFVFAITLPFDIRDLDDDCDNHVKTIPAVIGKKTTVILSETLLLFYLGMKFYQFNVLDQIDIAQFIAISISIAITILIVAFAAKKRSELYYSGLIEGTMLLLHFGVLVLEY